MHLYLYTSFHLPILTTQNKHKYENNPSIMSYIIADCKNISNVSCDFDKWKISFFVLAVRKSQTEFTNYL